MTSAFSISFNLLIVSHPGRKTSIAPPSIERQTYRNNVIIKWKSISSKFITRRAEVTLDGYVPARSILSMYSSICTCLSSFSNHSCFPRP